MKIIPSLKSLLLAGAFLILGSVPITFAEPAVAGKVHTPGPGAPERKAILDALRGVYTTGSGKDVKFKVNHFKVHNGWAWINVVPLDKDQKPEGEEWPSLLQQKDGKWVMVDLVAIAAAIDDPVGPADPSPKFIRAVQKKYPTVPGDIFPKPSQ